MTQAAAIRPDRLRVVQVIPILAVGGLERVATALTLGLNGRVERIVVCSKGRPPFEPVLVAAGVPVTHIPRPRPNIGDLARSAFAIARVLRRERPHVVHAHNPAAGVAAAVARRLAALPGVAIVTTYHGVMPERISRAVRAMEATSDLVVGVSPTSSAALLRSGLRPERGRTVQNAVDVRVARSAAEVRREFDAVGADLLVTVGRYVEEKNHALLLDAVAMLASRRPRVRALLVGVGPLEAELRARIAALSLPMVATLTGERADAEDLTAAADTFVLSSSSEGLPIALLEAMALGTPVVATAVGGVGDAVTDGETGLLVPPGNASALATAIERALDDAPLRDRLVAGAREFIERTSSVDAMVDAYLDVYLEALRLRARR